MYDCVVESMRCGVLFDEDDSILLNYLVGYKYELWSIEDIMEDMKNGKLIEFGLGNWD